MAFIGIFNFIISGERTVVQRKGEKKKRREDSAARYKKAAPL
jgi:hypothetical protein